MVSLCVQSHIDVLETTHEVKHALLTGLEYLIKISKVNDTEVQEVWIIWVYSSYILLRHIIEIAKNVKFTGLLNLLEFLCVDTSKTTPQFELSSGSIRYDGVAGMVEFSFFK